MLASFGGGESVVRLWDVESHTALGTLTVPDDGIGIDGVSDIAISTGGLLATVGGDDSAQLWNLANRTKSGKSLNHYPDYASDVAFNPAGTILATCSDLAPDDGVQLRTVQSHAKLRKLQQPLRYGCDLIASPTGDTLAVATGDGVGLWSFSGTKLRDLAATGWTAFRPDGKLLASTGSGLQLWDVGTGQPLVPAANVPHGSFNAVAFSPDGATIATGGSLGIKLWKVADLLAG